MRSRTPTLWMLTLLALCLSLAAALPTHAQDAASVVTTATPDTLRWSNGDSLHGRLLSAKDNVLHWKSPLFVDPVQLDGRYLTLVEFGLPPEADEPVRDPLRVVFRNGDVLFAKLEAIDETTLTFNSRRHGVVRVRRGGIRMLERMDNPGLVYVGPLGIEEWSTLEQGQAFEKWEQTADGPLATTGWRAELFRELPLPEQTEIEVTLQSVEKPEFLLAFSNRPDDSIRIETWDDEVVALAGEDFEPIMTIGPRQTTLQLRLYLDRVSGQLAIYSSAGQKLCDIKGSKLRGTQTGFYLRNKGDQIQLNALRVSRWSGAPPQGITERGSRIHLAKGTAIYGELASFDAKANALTLKSGDDVQQVSLNDVDRIFLADDEKDVPTDELAQAFYYDGTRITGNLVRIENGQMLIQPNLAAAPIASALAGMRRLVFRQPEDLPEDGHDRVYWDGGSLRGTLAGGDTPETAIQWRPVGGLNSTNLAAGSKARFVRSEKSEGIKYDRQKFNDMVFLTTRDVIPCRVRSIDHESVHLETALAAATRIPVQFVRAIELADSAEPYAIGFGGDGWKQLGLDTGGLQRNDEQLTFNRLASIGHPDLLRGSDVTFRLTWNPQHRATVGLAVKKPENETATALPQLTINLMRESVIIGPSMDPDGFLAGARNRADKMKVLRCESGNAVVRLRLKRDGLSLEVNDEVLFSFDDGWPKPADGSSSGFGFALFVDPGNDSPVTISDFAVNRSSGPRDRTEISDAVRQRALLIPRFRRENPSTHVLIAPNGDILRGRLTGLRNGQITFESQLEPFTFDRGRVASIVWLHPTGIEESPGWDESRPVVRAVLNGNLMVSMQPEKMADGRLVGNSPLLGSCAVPVGSIVELQAGGFGPIDDGQVYANWMPQAAPEPDIPNPDAASQSLTESPLVGTPARNFSVELLGGGRTSLKELQGKIIVLDFWASWCGPCVKAMPEVIKVTDEFADRGVFLIALNQEEHEKLIGAFLISNGLRARVGLDRNASIARQFGVDTIPQTFVIDQQGLIAAHAIGATPNLGEALRTVIEDLLKPKDDADPAATESQ